MTIFYFYAEIIAENMYKILRKNLRDVDVFLRRIKNLMEHPDQLNLRIE